MAAASDDRRTIGGPLRWGLGLALVALAALLLLTGHGLDYGVAWTTWVPAALLLLPAPALLQRVRLRVTGGRIERESGWLFRRCWSFPLAGSALEVVPTAGLAAVVLHAGGRETALAAWVTPAAAARLCAWLDARHPAGAWPRRASPPPPGDR